MIPAPAFCQVVEHAGQIQQFLFGHLFQRLAAQGIGLPVFVQPEMPHVADHKQDMFVHRIDMEQVELHQPFHLGKLGHVRAQHAVFVHAPQLMADPVRLADNLQEQALAP